MNFVSYLRVSTQRQGASGLGVQAQRTSVEAYLRQVGGTLLREFVEVESGSGKARPLLVQSIALCRSTKATLLIAKLDRLARNVAFVSSLMEGGVEFVAADAPYANRLMIHILAAFAEHERSLISERTKAALLAAKQRGVVLGQNGAALAARHRAAALQHAEGLRGLVETVRDQGACRLQDYASELNKAGAVTRQGARWSTGTVHRLLRRLSDEQDAIFTCL